MSTATSAVRQFLDAADQWLAGMPASPITEFLSGALLLARRTLFPSGAFAGAPDSLPDGFVGWDIVAPAKVEERGLFSDGDEPFVAVLRIVSTTGVEGSTKYQFVTNSPSESGSVKAGGQLSINDATGDAWFTGDLKVEPLDEWQFLDDKNILKADVMATVAFVFEADRGNPATDVSILKQVIPSVLKQVADIVEKAKIPLSMDTIKDSSLTKAAINELLAAAKGISAPVIESTTIIDLINRFRDAAGDPNDFIGIGTTAFIPTTDSFLDLLSKNGVTTSYLKLHGPGEGDGTQAWTNAVNWQKPLQIPYVGDAFLSGDVWYGFLTDRWVEDWMPVRSYFPWQSEVSYWLKLTAAMRPDGSAPAAAVSNLT